MVKYLSGTSEGTVYAKYSLKYMSGESTGVQFELVPLIIPVQLSLMVRMKYIEGTVIVKREGKVVDYCTTYVPYRTPRPAPVEQVG
jgi:hypothetical protein